MTENVRIDMTNFLIRFSFAGWQEGNAASLCKGGNQENVSLIINVFFNDRTFMIS